MLVTRAEDHDAEARSTTPNFRLHGIAELRASPDFCRHMWKTVGIFLQQLV
jgi:hypothetical protein